VLGPDFDEDAPPELRPSQSVPNLFFSRKKVANFLDGVLAIRHNKANEQNMEPFAPFLARHLPQGDANEHGVFAANLWAGVRRFAAEPDFLAYSLLLRNKITHAVVRDNKGICEKLLQIFSEEQEESDDKELKGDLMNKQRLWYDLHDLLPSKSDKMWQALNHVFPNDANVNIKWLLQEDLYVLSPVVYTLRLQHLEECIALGERLEAIVWENAKPSTKTVTVASIEDAFNAEVALERLQEHDFTNILRHAFQTDEYNLEATREQDCETFITAIKHGEIFQKLYFPELPLMYDDEEA